MGHSFLIAATLNQAAVSEHFQALARELVRRGHRVVVLAPRKERPLARVEGDLSFQYWPSARPVRLRDAGFFYRLHRRHRFDCLLGNFPAVNWLMTVGWMAGARTRIAWYHTLSSQIEADSSVVRWKKSLLRWRKRVAYYFASEIVVSSNASADDMRRTFRVAPEKTHRLSLSLRDPGLADAPERVAREPRLIVCPGRLYPSKGQEVVVRAVAAMAARGIAATVRFLGEGPSREALENLARQLGVADRCEFLGRVSHPVMLQQMARAALVAVPSRSEAFGLVMIEALAVGVPLVASAVGGGAEDLRHDVEGLLISGEDPQAWAAAFERVLGDGAYAERLAGQGRRRFCESFEQSAVIPPQAAWLESLVARREDSH